MKIVFVISNLSSTGGAQRVMSIMANFWSRKGREIMIATFDRSDKSCYFPLDANVKITKVNVPYKFGNKLKNLFIHCIKIIKLRKSILQFKPDRVISFGTAVNVYTAAALLFTRVPLLVSERNRIADTGSIMIKGLLRNLLYPKAMAVVCQTTDMKNSLPMHLIEKAVVVENPVMINDEANEVNEIELPEGYLLMAVGHLNKKKIYQKGFDLLLKVFKNISSNQEEWNLVILGDGAEREMIWRAIREYELEGRVFLPGNVRNVPAVLRHGHLFALTSRYEGFPNALCEAMACGLPVVSFNCPTGPKEIIRDGIDGILVEPGDLKGLEDALARLMDDERLRKQMGARGEEITERFSLEKIMTRWETILHVYGN